MTIAELSRVVSRAMPIRVRSVRRPDGPALPVDRSAGFGRGFVAMRHRNYRLYWFGQMGSLVGAWMQSVALPWLVLGLGGSPLQLASVLALMFAPSMVLAPIGGVIADRIDKRRTLMAVNAVGMVQASLVFGLSLTGAVEIWHLYLLALLAGFVNAIEMPVRQAFAAELVPREDLVNAIALNSTSFNLSRVIGPAVAGVTIAALGVTVIFGINAVSYLSVLTGLALLDAAALHRSPRPERFPSIRSSLAEGLRYVARTPSVLWPLVLLGGMATFALNFQTLLPLFSRTTLDMDSGGYGALFAAMGAGSLVGSLTLAFAGGQRPLVRLILGAGAAFLALELGLGLTRSAWLAFPLVIGIGLASMLMINTINITVQNNVPHELRGRVMSLYVTVFAGTAPLGGLFAGAVAEAWGAPAGFLAGAVVASSVLALVAWGLTAARSSRADAPRRRATTEAPRGVTQARAG